MMLSELDLEDVEALHSGSSFLTADTLGPLLDHCGEALLGLSSLEEPLSSISPVHSHHAPLPEAKASDLMLPWLGTSDLLDIECPQEEDALLAMEWVSEKLELGELDLDSLLDSSDDCPDSPYSPDAVPAPCPQPDLTPALTLESPEGAVKSEPLSPALSPELGSEVELGQDLVEGPSHSHSDSDSDSGIESSPPHTPQSCKSKPYSRPQPDTKPSRPLKPVKTVEKKLKKMEQNKTAATRYRQKKRVEQEELNAERLLLEQKNQELSERAQALSKEIQYLKDLMEEVRRHHQSKTRTATK
ncbi:cyclic AMP-dependent transcription factor ATF-4 [Periophthalmus magnuspinnatus]|uniref:cyclic AMP-dependent transcription factor ATF-4 n=1 Tax=Periophthalmus magnuspinnatus TaxID=409849 RepID=UPI00145BEABB|nr:cyclic AMP-dependent transcription factor ATF-4 [Periophthalmus magnuspinnatus]